MNPNETQNDSTFEELLSSVETGPELVDPRVGTYDRALLRDVRVVLNSTGSYALAIQFSGLKDNEGRDFDIEQRVNIAESDSDPVVQRIFLATLHDLGVVPQDYHKAVYAGTDEARSAIARAVAGKSGVAYSIRISEDSMGFPRVKIIRPKR